MSPTAAGIAATLHALVAALLLWGTPLKNFEVPEQAIEVTMEEPPAKTEPSKTEQKPQAPPPPAAQTQPAPQPVPPSVAAQRPGLPPVEAKPTLTDKSTPKPLGLPPAAEHSTEPPKVATAEPPPPPKEAPRPETPPPAETKLPQVETPPAPLSMQDFIRAAPPPSPRDVIRPEARLQPAPPPTPTVQPPNPSPQQHSSQPQPSPLRTSQPERAPADSQASASLVNPADAHARSRIQDAYLWEVGRKISEHRAFSASGNEQGTVIIRLTIARDGRLMESSIARSSGSNNLDAAVLSSARQASPYAPLPAELNAAQVTFILPLSYRKFE
jgi:protein TonB